MKKVITTENLQALKSLVKEGNTSFHEEVLEVLENAQNGEIEADGEIMEYLDECLEQI